MRTLEIRRHAIFAGELAQRNEACGETRFIGIIAGNEHFTRAEARARFECGAIVAHDRVGPQAKDLDVEHRQPGIGDHTRGYVSGSGRRDRAVSQATRLTGAAR